MDVWAAIVFLHDLMALQQNHYASQLRYSQQQTPNMKNHRNRAKTTCGRIQAQDFF